MNMYNLKLEKVSDFIVHLQKYGEVIAPHPIGDASYSFSTVTNPNTVELDYNRTLQSIKKEFLPPREKILSYSTESNQYEKVELKAEPRIFLGVHSYNMQAVLKLDFNFSQGNPELNYLKRRENTTFIGVSYSSDKYHFGRSVGIPVEELNGFDLFLRKNKSGFTIIVVTEKGEKLLKEFSLPEESENTPENSIEFSTQIKINYNRLPELFEHAWNSPVWESVSKKCVGCGTCNLVCPTCYCFNVEDDVDISLKNGTRDRHWDGCMLNSFAAVAGGENFRESLGERQRHRIYRKFKYISDITGEPWCVGCGRCIAACTAGISIVDIVNQLKEEYEQTHLTKSTHQHEWAG